MSVPYDLEPEEISALEQENIISKIPKNGKRTISTAIISPPSSQNSMSSSSSNSIRVRPYTPKTGSLEIPETFESLATLEFLGYTRVAAGEIFSRWLSRREPAQNPDDLLSFALAELERLNYKPLSNLDTRESMTALGISQDLQDVMTDPSHLQVFQSETLQYWLAETFQVRCASLQSILGQIKSCAGAAVKRKKNKRGKIDHLFSDASPSTSNDNKPNVNSLPDLIPEAAVIVDSTTPKLDDHVTFYKGKGVRSGDFNRNDAAWYFTREEETAELYRKWYEDRFPWLETLTISIQVPKSFLEGLRHENLWFGDQWKELVWWCRNRDNGEPMPPHLNKFDGPGAAQTIEGPICTRCPSKMIGIPKEELNLRLVEEDCIYIGHGRQRRKGTQFVFMDRATAVQLATEIKGKVFIEITVPKVSREEGDKKK